LVDQDTSVRDSAWNESERNLKRKPFSRLGGTGDLNLKKRKVDHHD